MPDELQQAGAEALEQVEQPIPDTPEGSSQEPEAGAAAGEQPEPEQPKRKGGFIRKLEARDAEIDLLRQQLDLERREKELLAKQYGVPEQKPQQEEGPEPPNPLDFVDPADYKRAMRGYIKAEAEAISAAREKASTQQRMQQEQQRIVAEWEEDEKKAVQQFPDYLDVLGNFRSIPPETAKAIGFALNDVPREQRTSLCYSIAKNPEHLTRLAEAYRLDERKFAREFGKIEAAHQAPSTPTPKRTSSAPPPATSLRANSGSARPAYPANGFATQEEFNAWRANAGR